MPGAAFRRNGHTLGPRVPAGEMRRASQDAVPAVNRPGPPILSRIVPRACGPDDTTGACERPASSGAMTVPIVLGVLIPLGAALCVLIYLHRRNLANQKKEDANDPHKSLDFGLGEAADKGGAGKRKGPSNLGVDTQPRHGHQMSMDMNLSSPYLLPPGLQGSRESLHSLARTLHQHEDPYRPVTSYRNSVVGSVKSFQRAPDGASLSAGSSNDGESFSPAPRSFNAPPRQNPAPKSPPPPPEPAYMKPEKAIIENADAPPSLPLQDPFGSSAELVLPDFGSTSYPSDDSPETTMPRAQQVARKPTLAHSMSDGAAESEVGVASHEGVLGHADDHGVGHAKTSFDEYGHGQGQSGQSSAVPAPLAVGGRAQTSSPTPGLVVEEPKAHDFLPQILTIESDRPEDEVHEERGRSMNRQSQFPQQALGVPGQDQRRLSVGLRPLPPSDFIESEDPETRANRIRSFYKEYFEESKPEPMPAMPQPPPQADYYDDYTAPYHAEPAYHADSAAYYDPDSNAFVMPYAQPVSRRAMTPPPSGSRFPGSSGPPRVQHGSIGGMSMPGGPGPYRPGSAASSNLGPRPGSSVSNMGGRPRAGSSFSGGGRWGAPRRPMPPPTALSNLPNPSKLRDDSVALLGTIDFAPPTTFKDQAAGRPQSPALDKRPYQLNVPVHSPLVNAFDELPALPNPHLLRKSGTYTALDFAPPRKFVDNDGPQSDAGSIRSNRSGMSNAQLSAIRGGAGRVSRLPEDTIFASAQTSNQLKPSWNMRN